MKVRRIVPKVFGRFTSDAPLALPSDPMVVVFGRNESGKSTYLDLTVALLSSHYDRALMERYGQQDALVRGSITVEESGEDLTIEFGNTAKIPSKHSAVPRAAAPKSSALWARLSNVDLATVRNLFRLSSTDISDGDATKTKFKEYSLGDKSGQSVTGAIENLRALAKISTNKIVDLEKTLIDLDSQLSAAQSTAGEYDRLTRRIESIREEIDLHTAQIESLDSEIRLVDFCNGAAASNDKARQALAQLQADDSNGLLVPIGFGSIEGTLRSLAESISVLDPAAASESVRGLRTDIDAGNSDIDSGLQTLGLERAAFEADPVLMNDVDRPALFNTIRTAFIELKSATGTLGQIDVDGPRIAADEASRTADGWRQEWGKFGLGVTAQEFVRSPRLDPLPEPVASAPQQSSRNRYVLAGLLAAAAGVSFAFEQWVGAAVLGALAAVFLLVRPRTSAPAIQPANAPAGHPGLETLLGVASSVVAAESAESTALGQLQTVLERLDGAERALNGAKERVEELLGGIGLGGRGWTDVADFDTAAARIDRIAAAFGNVARLRAGLDRARSEEIRQEEEFAALRDSVIANLAGIGLSTGTDRLPDPAAVIAHITDMAQRYAGQSALRADINAHEATLKEQPGDAERLKELLSMERGVRDQLVADAQTTKSGLETRIRELREQMDECSRRTNDLATTRRITGLNLEISETHEKIRAERLTAARLGYLVSVVEERAKQRAEQSKPELHRRVQDMVLAVADDWESIGFPGDDDTPYITYKDGRVIEDRFLSTGACTLLFTAMRIAIMQQEAEDPNAPSLPLLCDDPLLHLDDHRIAQAFRMMKQQAAGHQIIYFTCKQEIVEMAGQHGVPVVTIG